MHKFPPMFSEFSAQTKKDWLSKVNKDLADRHFSSLQWETYEGFTLDPYYNRNDLSRLEYLKSLHNLNADEGASENPRQWVNNQYIRVKNTKEANLIALEALNTGADGLFFDVSRLPKVELAVLLKNIKLNCCAVSFFAGNDADHLLAKYLKFAKDQGVNTAELHGIFNFDPVGEICHNGLIDRDHFHTFEAINSETARMPRFYGITINTGTFHDSGANAVQEIAFGLNIAVSYLHHLTEEGMPPIDAVENLCISTSVGTSYFLEIAKLRALRYLFGKVVEAYGIEDYNPGQLYIHARSDIWSGSPLDPYNNLLRHTTQAMSAILGGCDALTIHPFDSPFADSGPFSRRLSRNISTILKEETYLDKVSDVTAGSYYIESITDQLITAAWDLFLQVEEKGGFSRAFEKGFIQEEVKATRKKRLEDISSRKQKLVGVNSYCQPNEQIKNKLAGMPADDEKFLIPQRGGAAFEMLRLRTENYVAAGSPRPTALLLMFGNPARAKARAGFTTDLLSCAGFSTVENPIVQDAAQLADIVQEDIYRLIVFCSSDEDYEIQIPETADRIRTVYPGLLLVAGNPKQLKGVVKHAAIDGFIHLNSDASEVLTELQDKLFS